MRMWMIPPKLMCKMHLLGEHLEVEIIKSRLLKGDDLSGWVRKGDIDPDPKVIVKRHNALINEMTRRGWTHATPMEPFELPAGLVLPPACIDKEDNLRLLEGRCPQCQKRILEILKRE